MFICTYRDQEATKYLNYNKMKRGLQKITNKIFVKSPKSALEVTEAFRKENIWNEFGVTKGDEHLPFFKACIQKDDFEYCIFSSDKIINLIQEFIPPGKRMYLVDATFKIVPQGCFKQLLIIHINYFDEKVSILWAYTYLPTNLQYILSFCRHIRSCSY